MVSGITLAYATFLVAILARESVIPSPVVGAVIVPDFAVRAFLLIASLGYCLLFLVVGTIFGIARRPLPAEVTAPRCQNCG